MITTAINSLVAAGVKLVVKTRLRGKFYFQAELRVDGKVVRGQIGLSIESAIEALEKKLHSD